MKEKKQKLYMAPVVKVVEFRVEVGTDGSFETRSIDPQTTSGVDGDAPGEGEQYNRVTFDGWGSNE